MITSIHKQDCPRRLLAFMTMCVLFGIAMPSAAADPNQGLVGDWLSRYASPRSVGIGGATVAVADEPQAALWNPASVAWLSRNQVQMGTTRLFEDTSVNGLAFAMPSSRIPSFALNILQLKSGEFERTNELNESLGNFDEGNLAFALTAAQALSPAWSVGVSSSSSSS